jgi:hypothetical protein
MGPVENELRGEGGGMDRAFTEVRAAFHLWEKAQARIETPVTQHMAFEAMRPTSRRAADCTMNDARTRAEQTVDDVEFERTII